MTFEDKQVVALQQPVPPDEIKTREAPDGSSLRYVSVGYVQRQMNEIFGLGGWQARALPAEYISIGDGTGRVVARVRCEVEIKGVPGSWVGDYAVALESTTEAEPEDELVKATTHAFKRAVRPLGPALGSDLHLDEDSPDGGRPETPAPSVARERDDAPAAPADAGEEQQAAAVPAAPARNAEPDADGDTGAARRNVFEYFADAVGSAKAGKVMAHIAQERFGHSPMQVSIDELRELRRMQKAEIEAACAQMESS